MVALLLGVTNPSKRRRVQGLGALRIPPRASSWAGLEEASVVSGPRRRRDSSEEVLGRWDRLGTLSSPRGWGGGE